MNQQRLDQENRQFEGTAGVSRNNRQSGFVPAFKDTCTGRVELARMANGEIATMHVVTWLPRAWARTCDSHGGLVQLKDTIVSGFVRDGRFYTREEVARLTESSPR